MAAKKGGKKKGADGKACWSGYRYAGTKGGKDKCVPTGKGKTVVSQPAKRNEPVFPAYGVLRLC